MGIATDGPAAETLTAILVLVEDMPPLELPDVERPDDRQKIPHEIMDVEQKQNNNCADPPPSHLAVLPAQLLCVKYTRRRCLSLL